MKRFSSFLFVLAAFVCWQASGMSYIYRFFGWETEEQKDLEEVNQKLSKIFPSDEDFQEALSSQDAYDQEIDELAAAIAYERKKEERRDLAEEARELFEAKETILGRRIKEAAKEKGLPAPPKFFDEALYMPESNKRLREVYWNLFRSMYRSARSAVGDFFKEVRAKGDEVRSQDSFVPKEDFIEEEQSQVDFSTQDKRDAVTIMNLKAFDNLLDKNLENVDSIVQEAAQIPEKKEKHLRGQSEKQLEYMETQDW